MHDRDAGNPITPSLRAGLRVSFVSLLWTILAGACAVAIGLAGGSLVLAAFGAIGLLDAAGSATLVVHFRHGLRHEAISERHERLALRVVTIGMVSVGVATAVDSVHRLVSHIGTDAVPVGIGLAGVSVLVLTVLAVRKRWIAGRIPSHALRADAWLSAVGAVLALITVIGTGLNATFAWWWVDPVAASVVAFGAIALGIGLARVENG